MEQVRHTRMRKRVCKRVCKRVEQVRHTRIHTHETHVHRHTSERHTGTQKHLRVCSHTIGRGREVVFHFGALALALWGRTGGHELCRITGDATR